MTVVAFSPARFTPDDLVAFDAIAWRHISAGLWSHITRQTAGDSDQVLVFFYHLDCPVFRFDRDRHDRVLVRLPDQEDHYRLEKDASGWTYLIYCVADEWR